MRHKQSFASLVIFGLILLLGFQNCGQAGQLVTSSKVDTSQSTSTSDPGGPTTISPIPTPVNPNPVAASQKLIFDYTGSLQTLTVPAGYQSAQIKVWGGGGTCCSGNSGGGGFTSVNVPVSEGAQFKIYVGGTNGAYDGQLAFGYTQSGASTGFAGGASSAVLYNDLVLQISGGGGAGADSGNGVGGAAGESSPTGGGQSGLLGGHGVNGGADQANGKGGDAQRSQNHMQCGSGGGGARGGGGGSCLGPTSGAGGGSSYINSSFAMGVSSIAYGTRQIAGQVKDADAESAGGGRVVIIFSADPVTLINGISIPHIATEFTVHDITLNQVITPIEYKNYGGPIQTCTVTPALPSGLVLDPLNCRISGTPTAALSDVKYLSSGNLANWSQNIYEVKASNVAGSSSQLLQLRDASLHQPLAH